jgi:hypothetical protein
VLIVLLGVLAGLLVGVGLGFVFPGAPFVTMPLFGLMFALLGGLIAFNRRVSKAQYKAIEGQPGAAAAVLNSMRGQWFVTPAVSVNAKQDMVHRVVGRCGVVLVGEGASQRVKGLLAKERKRLNRVGGETPVTTLVVGDRDGEVSIRKLQVTVNKLPRELKKTEVPKLERKLRPLDRGMPLLDHAQPHQHVGLLARQRRRGTASTQPAGATPEPEPPSHRTRSRVRNLSPTYRSQRVKHLPGRQKGGAVVLARSEGSSVTRGDRGPDGVDEVGEPHRRRRLRPA